MKNLSKVLGKFGKDVTKDAKKNLSRNGSNSTGKLNNSIEYKLKEDAKGFELSIWMEHYGMLLDAGQLGKKKKILKGWNKSIFIPRGKGFTTKYPNIGAIRNWIRQKPISSNLSLNSLSFLIARKIFNEGIQPRLFMSDAYNKHEKTLENELLGGIDKDIDDQIDKIK